MKKLIAAALLALSCQSQAQYLDPKGLLPVVREFMGNQTLEQAFPCGDVAVLDAFRMSCEYEPIEGGMITTCMDIDDPKGIQVQRSVYNCQPDAVSFLIDLDGSSTDLTRSEFTQANGNAAEAFLAKVANFSGYLNSVATIDLVENTTYILGRDTDHPLEVPAINISGEIGAPGLTTFPFLITVIRDVPGVAQVVRFRMNDVTWFRVSGFTQAVGR